MNEEEYSRCRYKDRASEISIHLVSKQRWDIGGLHGVLLAIKMKQISFQHGLFVSFCLVRAEPHGKVSDENNAVTC